MYLDASGVHKAGCVYLAQEIHRVRPKVVLFGHIHASYGQEHVVLDEARRYHDDILNQWGSYWTLLQLAILVLFARLRIWLFGLDTLLEKERVTTMVNASIVGGPENKLANVAVVFFL